MYETFADAFTGLRSQLLNAQEAAPRGQRTKELLGAQFALANPRSRLAYHPARKMNLAFGLAEAVLLFQNSNSVELPAFFNKNIRNFSDDGERLHGSYGFRVFLFVYEMVEKLRKDPDSRQAVINIYDRLDLVTQTKDVPCTVALHCMIRHGKLDLHVYMRSNDLIWGTTYDVVAFTLFQEVIANELGLDVGTYYHTASSLHVYERHFELLERMEHVQPVSFFITQNIEQMCAAALAYKLVISDSSVLNEGRFHELWDETDPFTSIFMRAKQRKQKETTVCSVPEWSQVFFS